MCSVAPCCISCYYSLLLALLLAVLPSVTYHFGNLVVCHVTYLQALLHPFFYHATTPCYVPCYWLCYSLLLTKSKLEEVLLGPQEALTSCRQMMKLWKDIHEIEDEE